MQRLLAGRPERTDGARTISNLAREANVSRVTANRAAAVLAEFRAACDGGDPRSPGKTDYQARVSVLKKRVWWLTADVTRIQGEKEALALASLVLFEENLRFAERLNAQPGTNMRVFGRPHSPNSEDHGGRPVNNQVRLFPSRRSTPHTALAARHELSAVRHTISIEEPCRA